MTLLSETTSTGPYSVLELSPGNPKYLKSDKNYDIYEKFLSYKDKDGDHFLQNFGDCSETAQFKWGYHPPEKFKVLIYFPKYDKFVASEEAYERYAFDSYYKVDLRGLQIQSITTIDKSKAVKNYDYTWQLISLIARIIETITIEVLIALLFGFRAKKQLFIIGIVNIITQSLLNVLLNVSHYAGGSMMFVFNYIWMEVLVFIVEAASYAGLLDKYSATPIKKWRKVMYALIANAVSFIGGIYIAYIIPGIF